MSIRVLAVDDTCASGSKRQTETQDPSSVVITVSGWLSTAISPWAT